MMVIICKFDGMCGSNTSNNNCNCDTSDNNDSNQNKYTKNYEHDDHIIINDTSTQERQLMFLYIIR